MCVRCLGRGSDYITQHLAFCWSIISTSHLAADRWEWSAIHITEQMLSEDSVHRNTAWLYLTSFNIAFELLLNIVFQL